MSSDSSFNIHNPLYFVKYTSRAAGNSPEGRELKTTVLPLPKPTEVRRKNIGAQKARIFCDGPKLKDDVPQQRTSGVRRTKPA